MIVKQLRLSRIIISFQSEINFILSII
jgi:hypothetical protein